MQQFDDHLAHLAETTPLQDTGDFGNMRCCTRLSLGEDVDKVGGHSLLGNQDFLGTVDDKVTTLWSVYVSEATRSHHWRERTISSGHSPISYCVSSETLLVRQKFDRNMIGIWRFEHERSRECEQKNHDLLVQHMPSRLPHPRRCRLRTTWVLR